MSPLTVFFRTLIKSSAIFLGAAAALPASLLAVIPRSPAVRQTGRAWTMAAGVAALVSKKQVDEVSPPRQTVDNVKKDINEVKDARHDRT